MDSSIPYSCIMLSGIAHGIQDRVASSFCQLHPTWSMVNTEWFYTVKKPSVRLSNGKTVPNWYTNESINWKDFNSYVKNQLKSQNVLLVTSLPCTDKCTRFKVTQHVCICEQTCCLPDKEYLFTDVIQPLYEKTINQKIDHKLTADKVPTLVKQLEEHLLADSFCEKELVEAFSTAHIS